MTMLAKVQMPFLVNTMSFCRWEELNVVEGNACNYFRPIWKPAFRPMPIKVSQIASWVLVHSLPWAQCKKWIPIELIGCVHTHQGMHVIEGWSSPSQIQNVVQDNGEDNRTTGKTGRVISQALSPRPKQDKIQARWASDVPSESMLKRVWWCRCFKTKSWSWTICCLMSCSNGRRNPWVGDGRRSHIALRCCWKRNVLLLICAKVSRRKGCWSTINLAAMIKATKA